ncbi:MAG: Scr1 family TA system antitoxin-like transcriptional regulator [Candidatus Saccharimonadales bacterium]
MSYADWKGTSWPGLCREAQIWNSPGFSEFLEAERRVSEHSAHSSARYRNTKYFPGTLQHRHYIEETCRRSSNMDKVLQTSHSMLRQTRRILLQQAGVRQSFLVDEIALTYLPGQPEIIAEQLYATIEILKKDRDKGKASKLDFRVVLQDRVSKLDNLPYGDTFALFQTGDEIVGFEDHSLSYEINRFEGPRLADLQESWSQIGNIALDRAESLDFMRETLSSFR